MLKSCKKSAGGNGRLPWSVIHSKKKLCFDLQASQASNLKNGFFTVPLANVDSLLLALPFEFRGLSCQGPLPIYRDLLLWPSGHKITT